MKLTRLLSSGSGKNGTSGKGASALAYVECLEKCKSGNDALQLLVRVSDTIGQMSVDDIPIVVKKLSSRFEIEQEAAVRAKIFSVLSELGELTPDSHEKAKIVTETANLLKSEKSHRAKSQGLATLLKLGDCNRYIYFQFQLRNKSSNANK